MATTTPSAALIPVAPVFTNTERLALAGFLAGYSGLAREAYELDLRQCASWWHQHHLRLFQARRAVRRVGDPASRCVQDRSRIVSCAGVVLARKYPLLWAAASVAGVPSVPRRERDLRCPLPRRHGLTARSHAELSRLPGGAACSSFGHTSAVIQLT